ncbi:hypothetical protein BV25DRAFT_1916926 [Artomyces pyxidatus]|uniref:Uncharacterized protein n=1 Tax=Artomyces pyxidatus TaxID=48021 RepID=A0ACB8SZC0_9AGAM|nr:hypothetical protein BV25DRAFT_1916926 [Artomyces pyxidatus]
MAEGRRATSLGETLPAILHRTRQTLLCTQPKPIPDRRCRIKAFMIALSDGLLEIGDALAIVRCEHDKRAATPIAIDTGDDPTLIYRRRVAEAGDDGQGLGGSDVPRATALIRATVGHYVQLARHDSSLLPPDSLLLLWRGLRGGVAALIAALRSAIGDYNALSPLSRLPHEIVLLVLEECSAIDPIRPRTRKFLPPPPTLRALMPVRYWLIDREAGWLNATHACRLLRSIAINAPCLWQRISAVRGPACAAEMLQRVQRVPVDIDITLNRTTQPDWKLKLIKELLPAARRLTVSGRAYSMHSPFQLDLAAAAPHLKTLELDPSWYWSFSADVFLNDAPSLRSVTLRGCRCPPWSSLSLGQLVNLTAEIREPDLHVHIPASAFDAIADALHGMRSLQRLTLTHMLGPVSTPVPVAAAPLTPAPTAAPAALSVATLPNLQSLKLEDGPEQTLRFLRLIRAPRGATATLTCKRCNPAEVTGILSALLGTGVGYEVDPSTHLTFAVGLGTAHLSASRAGTEYLRFDTTPAAWPRWGVFDFVDAVRPVLPLSAVTQLSLHDTTRHPAGLLCQRWHRSLGAARALKRLEIGGELTSPISAALSSPMSDSVPVNTLFLPRLLSLQIEYYQGDSVRKQLAAVMRARGGEVIQIVL